ncbi:hemolysin family protein [Frankia sp. Cppng1_Ct_nod]|uniref:hemolysin family protein n=1 Tax=Frankia sp. Cppng1_Ct_nod TaxID=2897162 RepID=UPI001040E547|nr:hemolysin family protein [Frankia sp. Cppng1_Ct_nod]
MSNLVAVWFAVVLLLANAFFVGAEFALISARRSSIEPVARAGSGRAQATLRAMENVSVMLAGAQLGITICTLGLGSLGEPAVAHLLERPFASAGVAEALRHPIAFGVAMVIVVFLHVVVGEMVPKNIALAGPDRSAMVLVPPLVAVVRCLRPAIVVLNAIANVSLRVVRVVPREEVVSAFTRDEVAGFVEESRREGLLDADQHGRLFGALSFDERNARGVLLPVDGLETIPVGATPRDVEAVAARTGFSRFPVRDSSGELTGYLHLKDVLETNPAKRSAPIPVKWVRPLARVGADDRLRTVLAVMQRSGAHLARVTDGAGSILGVVALEDVLEELVGEIRDENQPAVP